MLINKLAHFRKLKEFLKFRNDDVSVYAKTNYAQKDYCLNFSATREEAITPLTSELAKVELIIIF